MATLLLAVAVGAKIAAASFQRMASNTQVLADKADLGHSVPSDLFSRDEGMVTLAARDVRVRDALSLVCLTRGAAWRLEDGVIVLSRESRPGRRTLETPRTAVNRPGNPLAPATPVKLATADMATPLAQKDFRSLVRIDLPSTGPGRFFLPGESDGRIFTTYYQLFVRLLDARAGNPPATGAVLRPDSRLACKTLLSVLRKRGPNAWI